MKHGRQYNLRFARRNVKRLLDARPRSMVDVVRRPLDERPTFQGVYAISFPDDSRIIYIGRTRTAKNGLWQRLRDHLTLKKSNSSVMLVKWAKKYNKGSADLYQVRILQIDNGVARRNAEYLAISALSPERNRS